MSVSRILACAIAASLLTSLPAQAGGSLPTSLPAQAGGSLPTSLPAQAGGSYTGNAPVLLVGGGYWDDDDDIDCDWPRDRYERRQCERWRDRQDRRDRHKRDKDTEAAIGLGILGLAVGAIVAGSVAEQNSRDRQRDQWSGPCHRRYGYDRRSNTFIGEGGRRFYCR
ncbi:hypothetical protein Amn_18560 [Aminobacter sp. Y103A]|jgi:hypothetical protein|uniref:hypothetical protein n=1 Tax=unclassified Aminobacter TaxID=2644704 RepID=UPI00177BC4B5|nr:MULTISPECIES: hypothetical protein [unclassified Aminobacter]QOF72697.1 hypothetical protein IG197_06400 [Aminobacter sp. SR38]BBD36976.1 hypothetical protein Amn_18560 [Aminobacter sp. SS-2016]